MTRSEVVITLCLFVAVGFAGGWLTHSVMRRPLVSVPMIAVPNPQPLGIRCHNGAEPTMWSQADAEARYHEGAMWQRTAEEAGVWNGRGQRAFRLAVLAYLEVVICRPEMP